MIIIRPKPARVNPNCGCQLERTAIDGILGATEGVNVGENKPVFTDENSVKQNPHCHSLSSIVLENEMSESGKTCSASTVFP